MRKIDTSKLKKGDIILSTSTKFQSKLIKFFTNSDVSHAMLYVANGSVMDSTGDGVHARNIQKMFYDDSCAIYAYRPIKEVSAENLAKIVTYMRSQTGAPYTKVEAIVSPLSPNIEGGRNQFCSRLVARAYESVGLNITENADFATPADIQRSSLLEEIPDVAISVSAEDQEFLDEWGDKTIGMHKVTNDLLSAIRKITSSITVLNDIEPFLLENPEFDTQFAEAFQKSGFLDYWKIEVQGFSWRYDPVSLVQFYHACDAKEEVLEYCRETLRHHAEGDFDHWKANLEKMQDYVNKNPLKTFNLQLDLYLILCFYHHKRVTAANILLKVYDQKAP